MTPALPTILRRFARDQRAVSAVEFALCLPLMLILYLGGIQVSEAVSANRKVTLLTRTVGDLVAQASSVSNTDVSSIFSAASAVLYPYPLTSGGSAIVNITVSEVETDTSTVSKLKWSCVSSTTSPTTATCAQSSSNPVVTIPGAENSTGTVKTTVTYTWRPTIAYALIGTISMSSTLYMRPRLSTYVTLTAS